MDIDSDSRTGRSSTSRMVLGVAHLKYVILKTRRVKIRHLPLALTYPSERYKTLSMRNCNAAKLAQNGYQVSWRKKQKYTFCNLYTQRFK
jgi:hypothetical protein